MYYSFKHSDILFVCYSVLNIDIHCIKKVLSTSKVAFKYKLSPHIPRSVWSCPIFGVAHILVC